MTIIPSPGPRPAVAPRSTPIVAGSYTVNAGETVYATGLSYLFESDSNLFLSPLINNGTIWSTISSDISTVFYIGRYNNLRTIENHGLIVLEAGPDTTRRAVAFEEAGQLTNSGQILVFHEGHGAAIAFQTSLGLTVDNSGTIAARSLDGAALALSTSNSGTVVNRAGASILVEGPDATAIYMGHGGEHPGIVRPPQVTNAGRIEAVSTDPDAPSVALWLGSLLDFKQTIVNSGVIKADIAVYADDFSGTVASRGIETVLNDPGGLIQGMLWLARGDDVVRNRGTIEGDVYLGEGADSFDNDGGTLIGFADMGWGNDSFIGSAGTDYVGGSNGDDSLQGGAGEDILLGGSNNDTLIGGAGNDSLFGEYGNDRIVTQGADFVLGGAGDDRIEAGDLAFELIDGETGFDTLVLPGGARTLDLAAAVASGRLYGIEQIVLADNQGLVVRYADVAAITDGHQLIVSGNATNLVSMVGSWAEGAAVTFNNNVYRSFANGDATILVQQGAGAQVGAGAPPATGLDPIAGGPLALLPDTLTDTTTILSSYELTASVRVNPEETWIAFDGDTALTAWASGIFLVNDGTIASINDVSDGARALDTRNIEGITNNGTIIARSTAPGSISFATPVWAVVTTSFSPLVDNFGLIEARSAYSKATALEVGRVNNAGTINAISDRDAAIGVYQDGGLLQNSGTIHASGAVASGVPYDVGATGVYMRNGGTLNNSGLIEAVSTVSSAAITYGGSLTVNNVGVVRGSGYAILFPFFDQTFTALTLVNSGQVYGDIKLNGSNDSITNKGLIDGRVMLQGGDDLFDGREGSQTGPVDGGAGNDQLLGGAGADVLIGGAGADILQGFAGADRFVYLAAADSVSGSADRIKLFETGIDKIDLRALHVSTVSWTDQTDPSDGSFYSLVSVTAAEGTLSIRVDAHVAMGDFLLRGPPILGTEGVDSLGGTAGQDDILGLGGNDILQGLDEDDSLDGGAGDDLIDGGAGADTMTGGAGNDVFIVDNSRDTIVEAFNQGFDEVRTSVSFSIAGIANVENLIGTGAGNQSLTGNGLNNYIDGGPGADIMIGGNLDDVYIVDNDGDQVLESSGGGGGDEIRTTLSAFALPFYVEKLTGLSGSGQTLIGNDGFNLISGGAGNDSLYGGDGFDDLRGNGGNDVLDGGIGVDTMAGGAGDDVYYVDTAYDFVSESVAGGTDEVRTDLASYSLQGTEIENVTGLSSSGQTLTGSDSANLILAGSGNDVISGGGGADTIRGGGGDDVVTGGGGGDTIDVGSGADRIVYSAAGDSTGPAPDLILGFESGIDKIDLTSPFLQIRSISWVEQIDPGDGALYSLVSVVTTSGTMSIRVKGHVAESDFLHGPFVNPVTEGDDSIDGTSGPDTINGLGGNDVINGLGANDDLDGGPGSDTINGNDGDDILRVSGSGSDIARGGAGEDRLILDYSDAAGPIQTGYLGNPTLPPTGISYFGGGRAADAYEIETFDVTGSQFADSLFAGGGGDRLSGLGGDDMLDGGLGADTMAGGLGNDIFLVDDAGDAVIELGGEGNDEVRTALASYVLAANVELLTGTSNAGQALTGNDLANVIVAGAGNDLIDGGAGADAMTGGLGNDVYVVDSAGDSINESAGGGSDEIRTALAAYSISGLANVENLTGLGSIDQTLTGNGADNVIDGGGGADTMTGGLGNDVYIVDNGGDVVVELAGEGSDEVRTAIVSYSIAGMANVEKLTATSDFNHDFRGNGGDNVVTGAGGNDFIRLQDGGVDTVNGAGGNDVFLFGAALTSADIVNGGAGNDQVAIQGDYSGGLTLGANFTSVESFAILPGSDTRFGDPGTNFYDYNLTTVNANVAAGVLMIIDANRLRPGEDFTFNGSAETDGNFFLYGGGGTDTLLGGSNNDTFYFGENGQFGATDHVDGGVSGTDQLGLRGNYNIVFGADQMVSIESIGMVSAQDTRFGALGSSYNYNLTMNDGNLAAGVRMTIDAAPLRPNESLTFNGSAETDGWFRIFGGRGSDTITGSQTADIISGGLGSDNLRGAGGADTFLYRSVADSLLSQRDSILDFSTGDRIDFSQIDAISGTPANDAFTFIGSAAFSGIAGELRATFYAGNGLWTVSGDVNGDGVADIEFFVTSDHPITGGDFTL